jgi:glutaredoxin
VRLKIIATRQFMSDETTPGAADVPRVVLYTRRGCHLCDDAKRLLEAHGLAPASVDIDADPALRKRFDTCVPVVEIDGRIRFRGRVEPMLLRRLLQRGE